MPDHSKRFILPFWAWILWILLLIVTYFDFLTILGLVDHIANTSTTSATKQFFKLLFILPILQLIALTFIYKGKKLGIWILAISYLTVLLINFFQTGTLNYISIIIGYTILFIFRMAILKTA